MSNLAFLEIQHLSKNFVQGGVSIKILEDINVDIFPGELVAIIGASGSGKSTLLQIIGLLDSVFTGKMLINGIDSTTFTPAQKDQIRLKVLGFVYQYHHLLKDFSAQENVMLPALIAGRMDSKIRLEANALLDMLGIAHRRSNFPGQLSGGEQQRVAIARALLNNPRILLADEPTGNLDATTAQEVFGLFLDLIRYKKTSAIVVTHNIELARKADRIFALTSGRLQLIS